MNNISINQQSEGEIVLYQPNESIKLDVLVDANRDTVWLNQAQMATLYGTKRQAITKHIRNIYDDQELTIDSTCSILELVQKEGNRLVKRKVEFYNLDMIISVGFRVNTKLGIQFRKWATGILKDYMLCGYCINRQLVAIQERTDERFLNIENRLDSHQRQLDFYVNLNIPPTEMVFFEGDFYKARVALENLVKTAKERIIIVDKYINALTLDILDVHSEEVEVIIYTAGIGESMKRMMVEHDRLFPKMHVEIRKWSKASHDRWLIIDDRLYHCGHSLNANGGNKISAITLMGAKPELILNEIDNISYRNN